MADDTVVTVAGTHGKSTTTSMITVLLQGAGLDPSFAIGANVPALGVNAAHGTLRASSSPRPTNRTAPS